MLAWRRVVIGPQQKGIKERSPRTKISLSKYKHHSRNTGSKIYSRIIVVTKRQEYEFVIGLLADLKPHLRDTDLCCHSFLFLTI